MSLPFLSPARTVLIIGDESLSVYAVTFNAVRLADTVPWSANDFEERVNRLIRQDCGGKPVLLVNDMTDQHFKGGQRMPKVSPLDRHNVLLRKLQVAFPNYPIRGALEIKQNRKDKRKAAPAPDAAAAPGTEVTRAGGGMYLFAAVPLSEPVAKTMEAAKRSMSSISGMVLLPVDSSDMVATLSAKLAGRERRPSRWAVFIGQHRGGALRQVITRDGQLAMTRMTPIGESEGNIGQWASDVAQEVRSTVSYLSRFGYSPDDSTDLIVVATPEAGEALKDMIDIQCNYTSFTVNEAARLLGIGIGLQEDQHYADPLHAGWIGRKQRFILPMDAKELSSVSQPRRYAAVAMAALVLSGLYLTWQSLSQLGVMHTTRNELTEKNRTLVTTQSEENTEIQRMQSLGFDVKLIQASIATYTDLQKHQMDALSVVRRIGQSMGGELRLSTLKVELVDPDTGFDPTSLSYQAPAAPANGTDKKDKEKEMLATLGMNFPSTIEPTVGVKQVNDFRDRLQNAFPKYKVVVTHQVADLSYNTPTSGKAGAAADTTKTDQDYIAELQIRGPAHD